MSAANFQNNAAAVEPAYKYDAAPATYPQQQRTNVPAPEADARFGKLRSSPISDKKQKKDIAGAGFTHEHKGGEAIEVIPNKPIHHALLASHFPNAARRMSEFASKPKPAKGGVLGKLKEGIAKLSSSPKDSSDKEAGRQITSEDILLWRRLHLKASDRKRQADSTQRNLAFMKQRREKLHGDNKLWKARVERMNNKKIAEHKGLKDSVKQHNDGAALRHKAWVDDRLHKLQFRDKIRVMKVKKIQAGRKVEQKTLKKLQK